jgi:hypothetical protein
LKTKWRKGKNAGEKRKRTRRRRRERKKYYQRKGYASEEVEEEIPEYLGKENAKERKKKARFRCGN